MVGHEDHVVAESLGRPGFILPFRPRFAGDQADSEPEPPISHTRPSRSCQQTRSATSGPVGPHPEEFAGFADVLVDGFTIVGPDGVLTELTDLLAGFESTHRPAGDGAGSARVRVGWRWP